MAVLYSPQLLPRNVSHLKAWRWRKRPRVVAVPLCVYPWSCPSSGETLRYCDALVVNYTLPDARNVGFALWEGAFFI